MELNTMVGRERRVLGGLELAAAVRQQCLDQDECLDLDRDRK
jgi:hypothetical protein